MADDEERIKAEKLAAAKKRVAQLQKQKKKAGKKGSTSEVPKDIAATSKQDAPAEEPPSEPVPVEEVTARDAVEKPATPETETAEEEHGSPEKPEQTIESPAEPMPETPTDLPSETVPEGSRPDVPRGTHGRQPSLSVQSKLRSSSFRSLSTSQGATSPLSAAGKASPLPPLTADGDSVHEVFRKHTARIEELEKENKRLEREVEDANTLCRKTEDQLQELREANVDTTELKEKLEQAEKKAADIEALKAEIASLQRQNSHLQTKAQRHPSASAPGTSESSPSDLVQQLESKSATIEAMELEISNLRAQLTSQTSSSSARQAQIAALEEKLTKSESTLEKTERELADTKHALTRASEKAVKEGVDKTSTETLIKTLRRDIEELQHDKTEAEKKIDTLEKKLQALGNLHRESESRHQARLRENEKTEKEAAVLRKRLASIENENLRLREERDRVRKRDSTGGTDDEALDELEDEGRARLERRIRQLEGEIFDLRRGIWKEERQELAGEQGEQDISIPPESSATAAANTFDDVDLVGGLPDHSRRRSLSRRQQHSSLSTVLSSGLAAFTGSSSLTGHRSRPLSSSSNRASPGTRGSLELLSEENLDDDFDEAEFARAQAEEEARKRVEWAREIKSKLKDWKGWRLDLVDSRAGAEGMVLGMGEIFEV